MNMPAVIFDMDGVIVHNNSFHREAWKIFCKKYNYDLSDTEYDLHYTGRTNDVILRHFFQRDLTSQEILFHAGEKEKLYRDAYAPHLKLAEGLTDFLEILKNENIPVGVASNAPLVNIDFVLEQTDIRKYFQAIIHADMVKRGKPDPEIYLHTAQILGAKPASCLVFEDSPTGIEAAIHAGMKVVGLTTTHPSSDLKGVEFTMEDFRNFRVGKIYDLMG